MRILGSFHTLSGRAVLAIFAAPVLASAWVAMSPQDRKLELGGGENLGKIPCNAETAVPSEHPRAPQQTAPVQYRNGELKWTPGPRALAAEWIWLKVREARMIAERSDRRDLQLPPELASLSSDPAWTQAIASERAILQARRATHYGFERELGRRLVQIRNESDTLQSLANGRKRERELLQKELSGIAYLHKRGLATTGRLVSLQRDMERLKADEAQLQLDAERVRARTGEVELELLRRNSERQIEIADGLRTIETRVAEIDDIHHGRGASIEAGAGPASGIGGVTLAAAPAGSCGQGE